MARTPAEVDALRPVWDSLGVSYIDAELDYFQALIRTRATVVRPHVALLETGGHAAALLVARLENAPFPTRVGYRTVYRPTLRALRVAHGGVSGAADDAAARAVVRHLESTLAAGEADAFVVPAVPIGSALHRALTDIPSAFRKQRFLDASVHWRLVLPPTFDDFLAARDKKSRYNLKRPGTLLQRAFGDEVAVEVLSSPSDHERIFRDVDHVAAMTYQRGLGVGFANTAERREQVAVALRRGWCRVWLLSIRGRPVGFWHANLVGDTLYLSSTGYDPAYAEYGVGTYLQMRMFEDMCKEPAVSIIDFGWGHADYKSRFGNESWLEQDITIFAPTLKGIRVALLRALLTGVDRSAKRALAKTGMTARVKRLWRARLRASP